MTPARTHGIIFFLRADHDQCGAGRALQAERH